MKYKIFVDGSEGTTGLQINERLSTRDDLTLIHIDPEKRKDMDERKLLLNSADIVFLCLPDSAAKESVALISNPSTKVIDASTAHRVNPKWCYGFPELSAEHREKIAKSHRVSVPGCYATGFISLMYPCISMGMINADYPVNTHAVSGYSGGGKKLINQYQTQFEERLETPQLYALGLSHKHIPEMKDICGLQYAPIFSPLVCNYYKGMSVCVPIHTRLLSKKYSVEDFHASLENYYSKEGFVKVMPLGSENLLPNNFINANKVNDTNNIEIYVTGNDDQIMLTAVLDNLGKGSSGAAVQCMNIMLGLDESTGL